MSHFIGTTLTPRHGLRYDSIPTVRGSMYGYRVDRYPRADYAAMLDCVYEMTDMVASSNGWTHDKALAHVLKDEDWYLLPRHKAMILQRLTTAPAVV